ncbi:DNA damage-regulated autophagy modulator protein 2-like isoform X1 [Diorhabda sublineata]|uniref:DNA damage-regulated autophagy modulator protein 2-like isoform X1 n=1 Tax=Diorhabda sublineata TaxID=1163346 RepID=UPI0024E15AE4|nr:DNA damage-regulated autophagy modulator protein 2-like isoform X1 [Diorhabda sublineata]
MTFKKIYICPILFGLWLPITVIITYSVSVLTEHVRPILPYISDTGTWAPESCIFGIMVSIGAVMWWIISYVRYMHIAEIQEKNDISGPMKKLNKYSLYIATLSVFGTLIVANFQVTEIFIVHLMGASLCFGFGLLYQMSQVILSFKMFPLIGHKILNLFRLFLTILTAASFMSTSICGYISMINFRGEDLTKWKPDDGGYFYHIISAISEYVLVTATVLHIATFVHEFRDIEIHQPIVTTKTYVTNNLNM